MNGEAEKRAKIGCKQKISSDGNRLTVYFAFDLTVVCVWFSSEATGSDETWPAAVRGVAANARSSHPTPNWFPKLWTHVGDAIWWRPQKNIRWDPEDRSFHLSSMKTTDFALFSPRRCRVVARDSPKIVFKCFNLAKTSFLGSWTFCELFFIISTFSCFLVNIFLL